MDYSSCDMHEELFVEILSPQVHVPLDQEKVVHERRCYEMSPDPSSKWSATRDLAKLYADAGHYDQAVAICKEAMENPLLGDHRVDLWFQMGMISEHKRDFDAALHFYLNSFNAGSASSHFQYWQHNNVAFCYLARKEFALAETHCRKALDLDEINWIKGSGRFYGDSKHWNAWKNMGVVMEHTGRYLEAASFYTTGIKLSHGNRRAVLHLRRLLERHPDVAASWKEPVQDLLTYYNVTV